MATKYFNLIRKHGRSVEIFKRNLTENVAFKELKHWKHLAKNSGGHVYFNLVEVPYELTPEGMAATERKRLLESLEAVINQDRNELLGDVA